MGQKREFTVENAYTYNTASPLRWIWSHVLRYRILFIMTLLLYLTAWFSYSFSNVLIGAGAEEIINPSAPEGLMMVALAVFGIRLLDSVAALAGSLSVETIAQRLERDSREELYISLLGKSQTFHDRQRVGDIMARSTDDLQQLNAMINPGVLFITEMIMGLAVPIAMIATIRIDLILVPMVFVAIYAFTVRRYIRYLEPVVTNQRQAFGTMNAGLEESISGIEVVKATAQEPFERRKFRKNARVYRDWFVEQGRTEAKYLPILYYGIAVGAFFLHAVYLTRLPENPLSVPAVIATMALMASLRFPVFVAIWAFSLIQLGRASAERVLRLINEETELDENAGGYEAEIRGDIVFENVGFGYEDGTVLEDISFSIQSGQTVAIVGQTGSGKSTLSELINRTYDVTEGRILIDGMDVREWNLTKLRSQISRIEQDVFLFSRTIAENIAFGAPDTPREQVIEAAKEAQAHTFIESFNDGYDTKIGERGVTLSGGQRQRIALARAFLGNPRILILDDSTSAIDSATEDEIQKAIRRAQQGRTTILITHRLSQIRWADHILVLEDGRVTASGSHDDLLRTSPQYRRIFARYDAPLPALEPELAAGD